MEADKLLAAVPVHALTVVAFIGAITALLGAFIAVGQYDLKRILAFSTVSQLGYMMLALGVGAPQAAIFHLLTHAFFKALLFLGAGSVIHAAHHEQDIRQLGGLSAKMKLTFATFAIGTMALVGVPLFFSGFWSKEAILHAAHGWHVSHVPFYAALLGVVLTAFYNTRLISEVFFGHGRSHSADHAHENASVMTTPLAILAFFAIALGFLGTPAYPWFQAQLSGESAVHGHSIFDGIGLMALSIVLVALGVGAGFALYGRKTRTSATARDPLEQALPRVFAALAARLGFDELYAATVGRLNDALATFADLLDRFIFDGLIRLLTRLGQFIGLVNRETDEDLLNGGFDATSKSLRTTATAYSRAQSGDAHSYLRVLALAFVVLLIVVLVGGVR
jgi:NADH-quinone oxidoreductase subunit L